jgi:septal ring factor EnvC (AmiA/AmiB activator)
MTALLDRVLNDYRGTDTSAMVLEELQKENTKLNANLSRMSAVLAQNQLEVDRLRRSIRRQKPSYSWLARLARHRRKRTAKGRRGDMR